MNFLLPLDGRDACPVCHSFDIKSCPVCHSFATKSGRHGIAPNIDERIDCAPEIECRKRKGHHRMGVKRNNGGPRCRDIQAHCNRNSLKPTLGVSLRLRPKSKQLKKN